MCVYEREREGGRGEREGEERGSGEREGASMYMYIMLHVLYGGSESLSVNNSLASHLILLYYYTYTTIVL